MLPRCGKVLEDALRRVPGGICYEGVVAVRGQVGDPGCICRDMLRFVAPAGVGEEVWDVEDAVGVGAGAGALCGEGLDVCEAAVLEGDGLVEGAELVVDVVDLGGVGELDGEDADATGSCVTVSGRDTGRVAAELCDILMAVVGMSWALCAGRCALGD